MTHGHTQDFLARSAGLVDGIPTVAVHQVPGSDSSGTTSFTPSPSCRTALEPDGPAVPYRFDLAEEIPP